MLRLMLPQRLSAGERPPTTHFATALLAPHRMQWQRHRPKVAQSHITELCRRNEHASAFSSGSGH